jgi:hypothetical protein
MRLDKATPGREMIIDRIPEDDQALLEYLVANSLIPNQLVVVKEAATSRGVITLTCGGSEIVFGYGVGSMIRVCPVD